MRFPLGVLAQYIGRKNATLVEMRLIMVALLFGYFLVDFYNSLLAMGLLLGIAGASFGVALSVGSGSFRARYKGLAMGLHRSVQTPRETEIAKVPLLDACHCGLDPQSMAPTAWMPGQARHDSGILAISVPLSGYLYVGIFLLCGTVNRHAGDAQDDANPLDPNLG